MNYINDFTEHMATFGLNPGNIVADGKIQRFGKDKNGWYVMFLDADGAGGAFGDWSKGINEKWCSFGSDISDPGQHARFMARIEESKKLAEEERIEKNNAAAIEAGHIWSESLDVAPGHPYLVKKQIAGVGSRIEKGTNNLIVPMYAPGMKIIGIQRIMDDGSKRFNPGCAKKGASSILKGKYNDRVYVCEGYATAATIHMATDRTVFIAFDSGNLYPVCEHIKSKTDAPVIVCGDDDVWATRPDGTPYNAGRIAALKCQDKLGCIAIFPQFANTATEPSDFNDLMCLEGVGRVKAIASDPWDDRHTVVCKAVKEWATLSHGKFTTAEIDRELGFATLEDRRSREQALNDLLRDGTLEHDDTRRGTYRARDCEMRRMDITGGTADEVFELYLPFDLYGKIRLSPRNIVMIAGEANAGKTTIALEILKENLEMYSHLDTKFYYLSSEMSDAEMSSTLRRFGSIKDFERCNFFDKQFEPYDAIKADPEMQNGIVFIDFLETRGGDYSKTVSEVQKIYEAMGNGIVILLVQKQPGKEHAKGGSGMLEKPRFALNLEKRFKSESGTVCVASVAKCKSVHQGQINPDGQSMYYIVNGKGTTKITTWGYMSDKSKEGTDESMKAQLGVKEFMAPLIDTDAIERVMHD
jgi:putative DNA primase/helicase